MSSLDVLVPPDLDGERADRILSSVLDVPRSVSRSVIDAGDATVAGAPVKPSDRLSAGELIRVVLPDAPPAMSADDAVRFAVLYEDGDLAVIDKPAGVVVHPSSPRSEGTLVHGLLSRYPGIRGVGQDERWGIVHRLDRDTSGLLVVALTSEAYEGLTGMMRRREINRRYLSVVHGLFDGTLGTIDAPIARDPSNPTRMRLGRDGRPARTHYRRLAAWSDVELSYLSVSLETGRTHQIRVHMQSIGHPIVGDRVYGRAGTIADAGRPWLHARQISFTHPISGADVDVLAPLPADLADSLESLGPPDAGAIDDLGGIDR